jgi:hypothetical protein
MQNRSGCQGNLMSTTRALPTPLLHQCVCPSLSTSRTNEAVRPAASGEILLAGILCGELRLKFAQSLRKTAGAARAYTTAGGLLKQPYKQE